MPKRRLTGRALLLVVVLVTVALFAVQGGEYGTTDLFRQRSRRAALQATVDSLQLEVDSLRRYRDALAHDPALQERIAREDFGMIRSGELLYRLDRAADGAAPADSVDRPAHEAPPRA